MGQATLDLPDPLEKPPPAPTTSADDLLAQLAGDEIDRLLADADNGKTAEPPAPPPVDAAPEPAPAPVVETVVAEAVPAPVVAAAEAPPQAVAAAPVVEAQAQKPQADPEETQTGSPERTALAADELSHQTAELPNVDDSLPFFLKPLVWLSSPLDSAPEAWREMIGKVAILTMVNAIAVLAYLIIFRRHH